MKLVSPDNPVSIYDNIYSFVVLVVLVLFCEVPSFDGKQVGWKETGSFEFPVIVNFEVDKAILIVPHKGCRVVTDRDFMKAIVFQRRMNVYMEHDDTVDDLAALCEQYQNSLINSDEFLVGVRTIALLIYPGTKWCGAGNKASNDSDLGPNTKTDACCRDHDSCQDYVIGFTCHPSNGLCNKSPFTRSNCKCDERFRNCLLNSDETASRRVGMLYFTVFGLKCFRKDYPIVTCLEYGGFLNIHCQKYLLDYDKEEVYQFFDSPKYTAEGGPDDSFSLQLDSSSNHSLMPKRNGLLKPKGNRGTRKHFNHITSQQESFN